AKMIELLRSNQKIQQELEESLVALRENNIVLDNLSKSDSLTGIWNRRGLYEEGQRVVEQCHRQGRNVLVVYADMNNLKIINDRYGHEEGDFSLKAIADRLVEAAGSHGIAGRIGGDEYAYVCPYDGEEEGAEMLSELYEAFRRFNEGTDKEYNVTISAGACVLGPDSGMSLEEALSVADERLYEVKKQRPKEVAKGM
ncbi:MAG: GGDEF domain-containing protein, partial [Acetatifactor sp.]|nr:GGDEF domain-containing protein [Acetatifactor sp.]